MRQTILRAGEGGYAEYRIPGIIATPEGLLLCCEARAHTGSDWGKIDVLVLREDGQRYVFSEGMRTVNNPTLIADGARTHLIYHVDYARAYHRVSMDYGKSWSAPMEITDAYRAFPYTWNVCATGPGHGIRLASERLIAPVWLAMGRTLPGAGYRVEHFPSVAGALYSDDGGVNWRAGALMPGLSDGNETTCAQLSDGRLLFNIRHRGEVRRRVLAISTDEGASISEIQYEDALPDPMCFGAMVRVGEDVYFINCDDERARVNLTLKRLDAGGWTRVSQIDAIGGYADLAFDGKELIAFYERGVNGKIEELALARIGISQIE
ncbi:MAG: exo-alpha-sialidase [Christensenellales bacterium]|jgi:sialidase-1